MFPAAVRELHRLEPGKPSANGHEPLRSRREAIPLQNRYACEPLEDSFGEWLRPTTVHFAGDPNPRKATKPVQARGPLFSAWT